MVARGGKPANRCHGASAQVLRLSHATSDAGAMELRGWRFRVHLNDSGTEVLRMLIETKAD